MISVEVPSADSRFFRAKSPEMRRISSNSAVYEEGMAKLYESAWRFNRAKNGEILKTLDNRKLPKELFRSIVRSGMNCKLTASELDALLPLFENDGDVDGCEFILLFYRLRYDHRSKLLTERVKRQRRTEEVTAAQQQQKQQQLETKVMVDLRDDFSEADLQSAVKKVVDAAVKYDRLMPGAVQLDAFESETMPPNVFREQLKLVFNIQLSVPELSAFIRNFNKENDNGDNINCAAFLVTFFRAGFHEKTRRLHELWAREKAAEEEREKRRQQEERDQDAKNALKVDADFTEEDKRNAVRKLRISAKLYDKTTPGAMSMKAFEVKEMQPHVFKEQLRRVFNLHVSPKEMGALMAVFDVNGDGLITCEEFSKVFLNMGFEERSKELKLERARQQRADAEKQRQQQQQADELAQKNAMKLNYTYTEEEYETAMEKLLEAAWGYDKTMPGAPCLDAFEARYMLPHEFKEQMRRSFYMKLTPQELGAIIHFFDPERSGRILCESFLKQFTKMGFEERQRRLSDYRSYEKSAAERKAQLQALKKKRADDKQAFVGVEQNFSEEDFTSAFAKLTEGAIKYNRQGPGAVGLDAFECECIPAHVFKEQLKMVFNVKVTMPELWALVSYFDQEQSGAINCKHFLNQFLRTGFEERNRIKEANRSADRLKRQRDVLKEIQREEQKQKKAWAEVSFDYSEDDFDRMLQKLVYMCYYFDSRQVGPAGLVAFEADSMTPAEFREQLKRTFNLKLTSAELGAAVTYFDTSANKKVANCAAFLNSLVQIRVKCEEFKGKKKESSLIADFIELLKEQFQQRMLRNPSVDARPWRQLDAAPKTKVSTAVVPKRDGPPPATPLEKYRRRIFVARRTGRFDLACKQIWAPQQSTSGPVTVSKKRRGKHTVTAAASDATTTDAMDDAAVESGDGSGTEGEQITSSFDEQGDSGAEEEVEDNDNDNDNGSLAGSASTVELVFEQVAVTERAPMNNNNSSSDRPQQLQTGAAVARSAAGSSSGKSRRTSIAAKKRVESNRTVDFRLGKLPTEVLSMTELTELWLCNNLISAIPSEIADLKQLRVLSLTNNSISSLPPEICLLDNLKRLIVRKNKLTTLPNLMGRLRKLKEFDCAYNKLSTFPEVLTSLPQLEMVDVSYNSITLLPASMRAMRCLTVLNLEGNAFAEDSNATAAVASTASSTAAATSTPTAITVASTAVATNTIGASLAVLRKLPWLEVRGCPVDERDGAREFSIRPDEEQEMLLLLRSRANNAVDTKARRQKIRNGNL